MSLLAKFLGGSNRRIKEVAPLPGPTSRGGATMNVYAFEDGSIETVEFDWHGREIARYKGEPRPVPPGVTMPPAPPRPHGAAPLPPNFGAPATREPTPAAPVEPDEPASLEGAYRKPKTESPKTGA